MARARPHVLGSMDSGHMHTLTPEASGCGEVGKDCAGEGPPRTEGPRRAATSARPGHREGAGRVKGGGGARRRSSDFYFKSSNSEHSKNGVTVPGALLLDTPSRRAPARPSHDPLGLSDPLRTALARPVGGVSPVTSHPVPRLRPPGPYIRVGRAFALAQVDRGSRARWAAAGTRGRGHPRTRVRAGS
ncbi:hypothetical protein PAL_GLEAN10005781 [Pteropus alecto]|uniref:Uncharacterized protein n=1 Tax=Pteropus alecto TaxID=9402 RepID=L5L227_PTEAL|nr:hypothetical protein PAL_GLEAN10005781 [Pteropus alecto]